MKIQVWCDTQCPFGLLAMHQLLAALSHFEHADQIDIDYRSFILPQCDMSSGHATWADNAATIFQVPKAKAVITLADITSKSAALGLNLNFESAKVAASRPSHRMVQYFKEFDRREGLQGLAAKTPQWAGLVMEVAFAQSGDISDPEVLAEVAQKLDVDPETTREIVKSTRYDAAIDQDIADGKALNIKRLPYFVINSQYAFAGPQEPEVFQQALDQAWNAEHQTDPGASS